MVCDFLFYPLFTRKATAPINDNPRINFFQILGELGHLTENSINFCENWEKNSKVFISVFWNNFDKIYVTSEPSIFMVKNIIFYMVAQTRVKSNILDAHFRFPPTH